MVFGRSEFVFELNEEFLELRELRTESVDEHGKDVVLPAKFILHLRVYHWHRKINHLYRQQGRQRLLSRPADLTCVNNQQISIYVPRILPRLTPQVTE